MKKGNLAVVQKKDTRDGLTMDQLNEVNLEFAYIDAILDVLTIVDSEELNKKTVSVLAWDAKNRVDRVFTILNGEEDA